MSGARRGSSAAQGQLVTSAELVENSCSLSLTKVLQLTFQIDLHQAHGACVCYDSVLDDFAGSSLMRLELQAGHLATQRGKCGSQAASMSLYQEAQAFQPTLHATQVSVANALDAHNSLPRRSQACLSSQVPHEFCNSRSREHSETKVQHDLLFQSGALPMCTR